MFRFIASCVIVFLLGISGSFAADVGVSGILSPSNGCGFTDSEQVLIEVTNFGTDPASGIDVEFSVDGIPGLTESIAGTLAPGATIVYSFIATADLSTASAWSFGAKTLLAGDTDPTNDELLISLVSDPGSILPLTDGFESYSPPSTIFTSGLSNLGGDDLDFRVQNGPTVSGGTGPTAGAGGGGNYIYIESSSPAAAGDVAVLSAGCIDLISGLSPRLVYAYHMYGDGIGSLLVTAVRGGQVDTLSLLSGQQQASNAAPWEYDTVDLSAYLGGLVEIRFQAQIGFTGSVFNSDIALDDILIEDPQPSDVAITALVSPLPVCGLSSAETVTVRIDNLGILDQSGFDVAYQISGPTGTFSATESIGGLVIAGGASLNYSFTAPVDFSAIGTYSIVLWTALAGDVVPGNDTLTLGFVLEGTSLPDYENFDSYPDATTVFTNWENDGLADEPFQVNYGSTSSTATGPTGDVNGSGGYIYMEASNMAFLEEATIRSQCIPLLSGTSPRLVYAYHMFGATIGSLTVSVESGGITTPIGGFIGQQQTTTTAPWRYDTLDLSPFLGSSIQIIFTGTVGSTGSAFNSDIALDDISIVNPISDDIGVSELISPVSSCGDEDAALVTIELTNFGTSDQSGFDVGYQVTGPGGTSSTTENVGALVLSAGATAMYSFSTPVDLSLDGTYFVKAWTSLISDGAGLNDTLLSTALNELALADIAVGSFGDDFDSYLDGTTIFSGFAQDPSAPLEFEVNFGTTSSTATGPSGDVNGPGGYVYMESSGSVAGDYARICSGCLDLSGTLAPELEMAYHMFGAAIGSLEVTVQSLGSTTSVFSLIGQQQLATTDPWGLASVDLSPWIDQVVDVCITGTVGSASSSFNSDIALDELLIRDVQPDDLGIANLLIPIESSCDYSPTTLLSVQILNEGTSIQTGFDVGYIVDGPGGVFSASENVGSLTIEPDSLRTFTFSTSADFSLDGFYLVKTFTTLSSDAISGNDTLISTITNIAAIASFPFTEDFESFIVCGTTCTSDCSASVTGGWIQDPDDDADWLIDFGGTTTAGTGPLIDAVPGTSGGIYLFTESSGACTNATSNLISPCIDLSSLAIPGIRFYYHMYGATTGTLALDISTDDGGSWSEIWSRSGQDQLASADPWQQVTQPFYGVSGSIRIRFRGITGSGITSDMAIDGIEILDIPAFDDLSATVVISPLTSCSFAGPTSISMALTNMGTSTLSGFNVGYEISGPLFSSALENAGSFMLAPGQTDTFTFATPANLSADGDYSIQVFPALSTDAMLENDTALAFVSNLITLSLPIADNFNGYPDGAVNFDFLENDPLSDLVFEVNYGPTSSTGTGPSDDVTIGGGYIYMETSSGTFLDEAKVCTPCLDLSAGSFAPELEYSYHMAGAATGSLRVDVLQTGITSTVDLLTGPQQLSETSPWETNLVDLSAYDGDAIQVCFTGKIGPSGSGSAFQSDIALDEIKFRDPALDDIGVVEVLTPVNACDLGSAESVSISIANYGVAGQFGFNVNYQVDGSPAVTEVFADSLRVGEIADYTFSTPLDLSLEGDYSLRSWTSLALDANLGNDTAAVPVSHILNISVFPYVEGFEAGAPGWTSGGTNNSWQIGIPAGTVISTAASGSRAMVTNLNGVHNSAERSYALSPCFDFSGLDNPGLRLSLNYTTQATFTTATDGAVVQSSLDQGLTWRNIGAFGDPDGWFNYNNILANPGDQLPGLVNANGWAGNSGGWIAARHALDGLAGEPSVIIRIAFASDASAVTLEGVALDDITVADMPFVNLGPDISVCAGYILDAGNPGDSYLWSTGETTQTIVVNTTGFYSVTVTDDLGFTSLDGLNITVLPSPSVDLGSDLEECGSVVLDAGNPGASYFWNTGESDQVITVTSSGTYAVLVTNLTGCSARDTVEVVIQDLPFASWAFTQSSGYVEFYDASTSVDSWFWDFGDGASSTDSSPNHIYGSSGNYMVSLIVTNACGSDTLSQTLAIFATGLEDPNLADNWTIYPVPTSGTLHMQIDGMNADQRAVLGVFNASGQLVLVLEVGASSILDLTSLSAGSYWLQLDLEGRSAAKAILIE